MVWQNAVCDFYHRMYMYFGNVKLLSIALYVTFQPNSWNFIVVLCGLQPAVVSGKHCRVIWDDVSTESTTYPCNLGRCFYSVNHLAV